MNNPEQTQSTDPTTPAQVAGEDSPVRAGDAAADDRRGTVAPNDHPVPSSPEPDAEAVRAAEEKLDSVKAY